MNNQNIVIDTIDGKIKIQFEHCVGCLYFDGCYKENGEYHGGVPQFITQECVDGGIE